MAIDKIRVLAGAHPAADVRYRVGEGVAVTLIGMAVNMALTVGKYAAGIFGHSSAMIADATHSLSDLLTDIAVLAGLSYTSKPADSDHAYGHGRVETLTAAFCGVVLAIVGIGVFLEGGGGILRALSGEVLPVPGAVALWAALASILSKEALFRVTMAVGRRLNSSSLQANAWHHRTDALSSVGALLGVGGSMAGGSRWAVLDPVAAVVVSVFIFYAAASIFWNSVREVLDTSLAPSQINAVMSTALKFPEIVDIHKIRTRRIGFYVALEAHILMDGSMSLASAHEVATALENDLKALLGGGAIITLHTEPVGG
ncbi:MAG: cation diffusion facilitator family transporter [Synergistaceae bacterium]|jgi:cation diffusion facilitator family transporter|nr:cation diffusion facilitator family transporter [Synergistaceae bacterium]